MCVRFSHFISWARIFLRYAPVCSRTICLLCFSQKIPDTFVLNILWEYETTTLACVLLYDAANVDYKAKDT